jgi:hypothetical protein
LLKLVCHYIWTKSDFPVIRSRKLLFSKEIASNNSILISVYVVCNDTLRVIVINYTDTYIHWRWTSKRMWCCCTLILSLFFLFSDLLFIFCSSYPLNIIYMWFNSYKICFISFYILLILFFSKHRLSSFFISLVWYCKYKNSWTWLRADKWQSHYRRSCYNCWRFNYKN